MAVRPLALAGAMGPGPLDPDGKTWQEYYRNSVMTNGLGEFPVACRPQSPATGVLLALSKYAPWPSTELRTASQRPFSRMGIYSAADTSGFTRSMEYQAGLKRCSQVLQLRADVSPKLADQARARRRWTMCNCSLRLDDRLRQEPLLIAQLVGITPSRPSPLQPIYEGLAQHRWNDAQLAELERHARRKGLSGRLSCHAMRGELTFAVDSMENRRITREIKTVGDQERPVDQKW